MPTKEEAEISNAEKHEKQLTLLKRQVKAIMEEAVTKKFIHEESPHVLRLCGTVEQCLLEGLKMRPSGFRRTNTMAQLYAKVAKSEPEVAKLITQIETEEIKLTRQTSTENHRPQANNSISNSNIYNRTSKHLWIRMAIKTKLLDKIVDYLVRNNKKFYENSSIMADPVRGEILASLLVGSCALEYTKVKTHDHYWSDPPADELLQRHKLHSRGHPNSPGRRPALHYSPLRQISSSDSFDRIDGFREYVESLHQNSKVSLLYGKNNVVVQPHEEIGPVPGYLSLHQEASRLLIKWTPNQLMNVNDSKAKNSSQNGVRHQNGNHVTDEKQDDDDEDVKTERRMLRRRIALLNSRIRCCYWEFAIFVDVRDIVYLHCHQQNDKESTLVLVGQDGVQWPPIRFPPGGHLLSFLSCLETALLPHGCLDPPLWSQKGKGKIFPRLIRRSSNRRILSTSDVGDDATDYVFRVMTSPPDDENISSLVNGTIIDHLAPPELHLIQSVSYLPLLIRRSSSKKAKNTNLHPNHDWTSRPSRSSTSKSSDYVFHASSTNGSIPSSESSSEASRRHSRISSLSSDKSEERHRTGGTESTDKFVPNLDMYVWDQSKPRRYNEPTDDFEASLNHSGSSLRMLCESMRRQIISRAFYGWLAHCRHIASVRTYLTALVNKEAATPLSPSDATVGITDEIWGELFQNGRLVNYDELARYVYFGGVRAKHLRPIIWLYLLGYYDAGSDEEDRKKIDEESKCHYAKIRALDYEIKQRYTGKLSPIHDVTMTSSNGAASSTSSSDGVTRRCLFKQASVMSDVFGSDSDSFPMTEEPHHHSYHHTEDGRSSEIDGKIKELLRKTPVLKETLRCLRLKRSYSNDDCSAVVCSDPPAPTSNIRSHRRSVSLDGCYGSLKPLEERDHHAVRDDRLVRSSDDVNCCVVSSNDPNDLPDFNDVEELVKSRSSTMQSDSSDLISINLTQIEKDVYRCDRNHVYFTKQENLRKLSNIMSCFVWEHPEIGYVQGMCDLAAPLLIVFDDESLVYSCFVKLMERITFQKGNSMDVRLANLRSLIQVLDYELYEHLHKATDSTHFFFCYRWFLLEFKRELSYNDDVYAVWECAWAARSCSAQDFGLFFALAMLQHYRDIILENELDFSGIVKFFNEMAEKHDAGALMTLARKLVADVQNLIQK